MAIKRKLVKLVSKPHLFVADAVRNALKAKERERVKQTTPVTLIVRVIDGGDALQGFIRNVMETAAGGSAGLELILLVDSNDVIGEPCWIAPPESRAKIKVVQLRACDIAAAFFEAIEAASGHWIGYACSTNRYSPNFFKAFQASLGEKTFEYCAVATDLHLDRGTTSRVNQNIKSAGIYSLDSKKNIPFLDIHNVFLAKQLIGVERIRYADDLSRHPGCANIMYLRDYLRAAGQGKIRVIPGIAKSIASDAPSGMGLFGYAVYPKDEAYIRLLSAMADMADMLTEEGELEPWLQVRLAYAVLNSCEEQLAKRRQMETVSDETRERLETALAALSAHVDFTIIDMCRQDLARWAVRFGMLTRYKQIFPLQIPAHVDEFDKVAGLIKIKWTTTIPIIPLFLRNGVPVEPVFSKSIQHQQLGKDFIIENIAWIHAFGLNRLQLFLNGHASPFYVRGKKLELFNTAALDQLESPVPVKSATTPKVMALRRLAESRWARERYADAWVFLDKDDKADDNAEHFYRWIRKQPERAARSFFVLKKRSKDWKRLKAEGFKLVPFGSLQHKVLLLNASWLFSSHAAPFVVNVLPKAKFGDMLNYKFCFLQHGVTKDDQSAWLNSRQIDLLVTAGEREQNSMVSGFYKYTHREVSLTGFPRFDALHAGRSLAPKKIIIMPTWRLHLAGPLIGKTSKRSLNPNFVESEFFRKWNNFLSNEGLMAKLKDRGYEVVFVPHPNIAPYLEHFTIAPSVTVADIDGSGFQGYLKDCALLITDYSSIAFDVAYLRRPVIYFQFDAEEFFASHSYGKGYYEYRVDGFGPVTETLDELQAAVNGLIDAGMEMQQEFLRRINGFFAFNDAASSSRLYDEVLKRSTIFSR